MKTYIGCKIIKAEPMKQGHFLAHQNKPATLEENIKDGYLVVYPDGYRSWSPKKVFENAYREILQAEETLILSKNI